MRRLIFLPLTLLAACTGGDFVPPIPEDQIRPLLVVDLIDGTQMRAPEAVVPTARRLVFRRMPQGAVVVSAADALGEAGTVATASASTTAGSSTWICTHELSQAQWNALTPGLADPWLAVTPTSAGGGSGAIGESLPAWGLDADSCVTALAAWTTAHTGATLRLPTTQEWESAARSPAGSGLYGWGDDPSRAGLAAWVRESGASGPRAITGHPALGGFLDLHGNVWEWVSDGAAYHLRGGSWNDNLRSARCANRLACPRDLGYALAGLRPVLVLP